MGKNEKTSKICITLDTDWAQDNILEYCFKILNDYENIKATIFATNKSNFLNEINIDRYEIGLHPNINNINNAENVIFEIKKNYPDSKGIRCHSLFHTSRLYPILNKLNIKYTSNYLCNNLNHIQPVKLPFEIVEIPIFFMDDAYFMMNEGNDMFNLSNLDITTPGLKVFAFHPIHIYLNTHSIEHYNKNKNIVNVFEIDETRMKGIRDFFKDLLEYINAHSLRTYKLSDLVSL